MRRIYYAIIALLAVFALCVFEFMYTQKTTASALEMLEEAVNEEMLGNHDKALKKCSEFTDYWLDISGKLQLLSDHNNLDEIDLLSVSAYEYLVQRMEKEFYIESVKLKKSIEAFIASETDIINNIL